MYLFFLLLEERLFNYYCYFTGRVCIKGNGANGGQMGDKGTIENP